MVRALTFVQSSHASFQKHRLLEIKHFPVLAIKFWPPSAFTYAQPQYIRPMATLKSEKTEHKTKGAFVANHQG